VGAWLRLILTFLFRKISTMEKKNECRTAFNENTRVSDFLCRRFGAHCAGVRSQAVGQSRRPFRHHSRHSQSHAHRAGRNGPLFWNDRDLGVNRLAIMPQFLSTSALKVTLPQNRNIFQIHGFRLYGGSILNADRGSSLDADWH